MHNYIVIDNYKVYSLTARIWLSKEKIMRAFNFITLVEYSGANALLESNSDVNGFATFIQISNAGYSVNKGAKSISIFTGFMTKTEQKENKTVEITIPTYARVFDIKDTSAYEDKQFLEWLKTEAKICENPRILDQKMVAKILN